MGLTVFAYVLLGAALGVAMWAAVLLLDAWLDHRQRLRVLRAMARQLATPACGCAECRTADDDRRVVERLREAAPALMQRSLVRRIAMRSAFHEGKRLMH